MTRLSIRLRRLARLPLIASLSLLAACDSEPIISGDAHPPMWVAQSGDATITIIGSVHLLPVELNWQDARVAAAIANADELRLEIAPDSDGRIAQLLRISATNEQVSPLDQRLGQALADRARDIVGAMGVDEQDADRLESWALMLLLSGQQARDLGLNADNGVEGRLTLAFQEAGKPIVGLETVTEQFNAFDLLPDATQDELLRQTVENSPEYPEHLAQLLRLWADGDAERIGQMVNEDLSDSPQVRDALVAQRNRAWVAQLNSLRERRTVVLMAVGTGHLVGADGVPQLLANAGWQVRPIR